VLTEDDRISRPCAVVVSAQANSFCLRPVHWMCKMARLSDFIAGGGIPWNVRAAAPSIRIVRGFADSVVRHCLFVARPAAARTRRKRNSVETAASA
jgi:hypothetical protein